jgi:flagellar biosynthesis/type III secretory pathway protein FliH
MRWITPSLKDIDSAEEIDLQSIIKQAEDEGYANGMAVAEQEISLLKQQLHSLINIFDNSMYQFHHALEDELVTFVFAIAAMVIEDEVRNKPLVEKTLRSCIQQLCILKGSRDSFKIYVNEDQFAFVNDYVKRHYSDLNIQIMADAYLEESACRVESGLTWLEDGLNARLKNLYETCKRQLPQSVPADIDHG